MQKRESSWKPRKRGLRWWRVAAMAGGLAVLIGLGMAALLLIPGKMLPEALKIGRLAHVPERASLFQIDGTGGYRHAAYYIRFSASAKEIDDFVLASPGLGGVAPEVFGPDHMLLPDTERPTSASTTQAVAAVYFHPEAQYPWFNPAVRVKGRRYVIPPAAGGCTGEVIIDDEKLLVYIRVSRGA